MGESDCEPDDAGTLAGEVLRAVAERLLEPLVVDRDGAAHLLGYRHVVTFSRDVRARRLQGFPQPLPQPGHPRWSVRELKDWVKTLEGRPRKARARRKVRAAAVALPQP